MNLDKVNLGNDLEPTTIQEPIFGMKILVPKKVKDGLDSGELPTPDAGNMSLPDFLG